MKLFIDFIQILLIMVTILLAILTIEIKDMIRAIVCLCGMGVTIGILFAILNAPYVAVFQLLIYGGAVIALFISVIMVTRRELEE
ncbi:MAG: NADH-quinone oxidoreductase subunit J [Candidatus Bathyarchaeota archaeon]|nr:MAG: NADH-quinone oxidoreductase subunit J [Candidatus Bathyarchaeota archaeon]